MKGEYNAVMKENKKLCEKTGKICYSRKEANTVRNLAKSSRSKKVPKRVYFCNYCKTYHLTHMKFKWIENDKTFYKDKEMY